MTDKECKFLHTAPCRKYMKNPDRGCKAQCKSYHPELCKYSRARRECCNVRCFRIHLKATRWKQTPPATQKPSTTPRTTNLWSPYKICLTTAPHTCQHSPLSMPPLLILPPQQRITTPHPCALPPPSHYCSTVPRSSPLHANPYTTSSSWTPQSIHPPQTSKLAPQTHYPTFLHIVIPPQPHPPQHNTVDGYQKTAQRGTTSNDNNIFLCTTTIEQHAGSDESNSSFLEQPTYIQ